MSQTTTSAVPNQPRQQSKSSYAALPNDRVQGPNGVSYAYRQFGADARPLVFLQHFRGNLDNWDPALMDGFAGARRVISFDNAGVGATSGLTPGTVEQMAWDALAFMDALGLDDIDLLGFSLGSFVAQEIALLRPDLVRRLILASSAPQGAAGMHGWAPEVIAAVGGREPNPAGVLQVFYSPSSESRAAGKASLQRITSRTDDRDAPTSWQTRQAQYDAVCSWGIPNHALLNRVSGIQVPALVANGDSDPMILPRYSHLLAGLLPDARLKIYPDAAHGFLFQHHEEFTADVLSFLEAEL
jgi:pimeloyl-ACP methyl ester carboxylesterase